MYLAKLQIRPELIASRHPHVTWDQPTMTVLRSCLMKPEHADWVPELHQAVMAAEQAMFQG